MVLKLHRDEKGVVSFSRSVWGAGFLGSKFDMRQKAVWLFGMGAKCALLKWRF